MLGGKRFEVNINDATRQPLHQLLGKQEVDRKIVSSDTN